MADWLVERGIGETRAVRIRGGGIVEARVLLDGAVAAGSVLEAKLMKSGKPAVAASGPQEYLLPAGAADVTEGAALRVEVTREAIPGSEVWKRPLARVTSEAPAIAALEGEALPFPAPDDVLDAAGWTDLLDEARSGVVPFAGGELRVFVTPAMTLIDVDGSQAPLPLALAGAQAAARTILRHAIGGSIGIDLPTVGGREERQRIGAAFDAAMSGAFERTAVNGFGFLQAVRPRRHASLFELALDRAAFEARALLRRAGREAGAVRLVGHPAVVAVLEANPGWLDALARQTGGSVTLRIDASLPIHGIYAEKG